MHFPREQVLLRLRGAWDVLRRMPWHFFLLPFAAVLAYALALLPFTPTPDELRKQKAEHSSVMLAADGTVLAEFKRLNREWRALKQMSPHLVKALIATEDHRFYEHHGIDVRRTGGAALATLKGDRQGGSTITQQLARNLYPEEIGRAPSLARKIKEAWTALKIEAHFSKAEILETYLNTVPFLYNAVGAEMAARTYFDKSANQLDLLESATLVGMLKGTSQYNPVQNPQRALGRRNLVLEQMARHGAITDAQLAWAQQKPLITTFEPQREPPGPAPHLAQQVRTWLADWADRNGLDLYADGLVVRTTIDARLQALANQAVAGQLARLRGLAAQRTREQPLQAGFLAVDVRNGEVRAWVGSSDYSVDQFDHVQQARRQPGSTFKPFVYGAAFAHGFRPTDVLIDQPVTIGKGKNAWSPHDVTPATMQPMTLADGLAYSRNSITVQVMQQVKPDRVADVARDLGVRESTLDKVPSLALGTSPVTLKEMVTAYASIARGGQYLPPVVITRVEDRKGKVLETLKQQRPQRALDEAATLTLIDAMRGVVDRGTARAIRTTYGISADLAGKTGTTQANTDGWFILMHPHLVAGAWVGFNDQRITMGNWGQGASSALPIVATVFQQALRRGIVNGQLRFAPPPGAGGDASWWARWFGGSNEPVPPPAVVMTPPPVPATEGEVVVLPPAEPSTMAPSPFPPSQPAIVAPAPGLPPFAVGPALSPPQPAIVAPSPAQGAPTIVIPSQPAIVAPAPPPQPAVVAPPMGAPPSEAPLTERGARAGENDVVARRPPPASPPPPRRVYRRRDPQLDPHWTVN